MLSNNPLSSAFIFMFPPDFFRCTSAHGVHEDIETKYNNYLKHRGGIFLDIRDYVNESIIGVSIPEMSQQTIKQRTVGDMMTSTVDQSAAKGSAITTIQDKTFTVTLRFTEGNFNYMYLMELFFQKYSRTEDSPYIAAMHILNTDMSNNIIGGIQFKDVMFTSIGGLTHTYVNITSDYLSFDCTFSFNDFEPLFYIPEPLDNLVV